MQQHPVCLQKAFLIFFIFHFVDCLLRVAAPRGSGKKIQILERYVWSGAFDKKMFSLPAHSILTSSGSVRLEQVNTPRKREWHITLSKDEPVTGDHVRISGACFFGCSSDDRCTLYIWEASKLQHIENQGSQRIRCVSSCRQPSVFLFCVLVRACAFPLESESLARTSNCTHVHSKQVCDSALTQTSKACFFSLRRSGSEENKSPFIWLHGPAEGCSDETVVCFCRNRLDFVAARRWQAITLSVN